MEAPEVPLEKTQDHINEHARESEERWILGVALSTAILAAVAAIASLLAGQHINEGMISQIRASDNWAYYQAKGIKAGVLEAKMEILKAQGKTPDSADTAKAAKYVIEQDDLAKEARMLEAESNQHIARHEKLASSVTLFQIGIAISAIAVLTKRRLFWFVGLAFGCAGMIFLAFSYR
jgi:hypothetical protein